MADNLFYNDAKEMVLKFIMKEFATMPEPLITNLLSYFYKFCSYEEEGLKIRPNIIFCNDINQIIKKHKDSQKAVTLVEYNKRLCAALLESEAVDYFYGAKSFEKEVLLKIGEEQELEIY